MPYLTKEFLAALPPKVFATLTTTLIKELVPEQMPAINAADIAALNSAQVAAFESDDLVALPVKAMQGFVKNISGLNITNLDVGQFSALSPSQFQALSTTQIHQIDEDKASHLSAEMISKLSSSQVKGLNVDAVAAIDPKSFAGFTSKNIVGLDMQTGSNQVAALLPEQVAMLSLATIKQLKPVQIQAMEIEDLLALTPQQLKSLTNNAVAALNSGIFAELTTEQVISFTSGQIRALSPQQISKLGVDQMEAFKPEQAGKLLPTQVAAIGAEKIAVLSSQAFKALPEAAVAQITPNAFALLSSEHIKAMNSQQIKALSGEQLAKFGNEQAQGLSVSQITQLSADKVKELSTAAINVLDAKVVAKMDLSGFNATQLRAFNDEQLNVLTSTQIKSLVPTALQGLNDSQKTNLKSDVLTVFNTINDITAPTLLSAAVNARTLVLTFNDTNLLNTTTAPTNAFSVKIGNVDNAVTAVAVDATNKKVTLTLTNAVTDTDIVTISYTDPTSSNDAQAIQDQMGNDAASFSNHAVTNTTPDTTAPAAPTFALAVDSGANNTDNITNNGTINVSGLETNATWQYSLNGGTTWNTGSGSRFVLPAATYAVNSIWVKQADAAGNVSATITKNAAEISVVANFEATAPTVYLTNDVTQLDSITALLSYNGTIQNNINYQNIEPVQWRTRPSSSDLATDLTKGSATTQVRLQGELNENSQSQVWYKIDLTQTSSLKILDSSDQYDVVKVAVFDSTVTGKSFTNSLYEPHSQLSSYSNLPAGSYFVRIDKGEAQANDSRLSQKVGFDVKITTNTSDEFILPPLVFNSTNSTLDATVPTTGKVFYKFKVDSETSFTLDTTNFATNFDINIIQPTANGYSSVSYSAYQNTPNQHIYTLPTGTYYLMAAAKNGYTVTQNTTLNIPVLGTPTFNTTFTDNATSTLKADLATAAPVLAYDNNGDLVMTYTFDVSPSISNGRTVTELTSAQKAMDRLALQAISDVTKIKFVEVNSSTASKANFVFGNVADLGGSAAQAVTTPSSTGSEISKATVEFSLAASTNADGTIGKYGYTTALHEISHALGIKHPRSYGDGGASSTEPFLLAAKDSNQYSLMSYNKHPYTENSIAFYSNSAAVSPKTLLLYDVAALQLLYGANTTYKTGNDTYSWDADVDPFMTIWDVDGTDTIDVSNQTQVQTIDLRAGYFSSLGAVKIGYTDGTTTTHAPKDNVSIAYGTVIEKAIGSNQNDTIIGNSVANVLTGNAGNDNFLFASVLGTDNIDTITDFSSGDKITLSKSIFTALNSGSVLTADEFLAGSGKTIAETSLQRIIFDTLTKNLYYDADGLNGNNPVQFAILSNVSELNAGQLFLQA